jgi:hypothetical protein
MPAFSKVIVAPQRFERRTQQIMRRVEGHQQGPTKPDVAVFTESAAVKVSYILSRLRTLSRHSHASVGQKS